MVDPKRVSVIQCDVTGSVILSDRYRGVTVPSCEIKRRGFSGTKGFCSRNKASLFKFHDVECSTQDSGARRGCSGSVSSHFDRENQRLSGRIVC
jgi:hypothetical protein